jgi:hypothetical protein
MASDQRWYPPELHPSNAGHHGGAHPGSAHQQSSSNATPGERPRSQQLRNGGLLLGAALVLSFASAFGVHQIIQAAERRTDDTCRTQEQEMRGVLEQFKATTGVYPTVVGLMEQGYLRRWDDYVFQVEMQGPAETPTSYIIEPIRDCL